MQEIEVPPRDVFQHYVHVDQPGKTLVWWFSTKKKSISFGLYFRKSSAVPSQLKSNAQAPSLTSATPPSSALGQHQRIHSSTSPSPQTAVHAHAHQSRPQSITSRPSHSKANSSSGGVLSSSPKKSNRTSHCASSRGSGSAETSASDDDQPTSTGLQSSSQSSLPSTTQPSLRKKKTVAKLKDPDLIEILPIQHYDSSTGPVRGEHTIKEEGSYVLVFGKKRTAIYRSSLCIFWSFSLLIRMGWTSLQGIKTTKKQVTNLRWAFCCRQLVLDQHLQTTDLFCGVGGTWTKVNVTAHIRDVWLDVEKETQAHAR